MISRRIWIASAAAALAVPAWAQTREPTAAERTRVEDALRKHGFTEWGKIELDDDVWVVEDAVDADGKEWEIELDAVDLRVLNKEPG